VTGMTFRRFKQWSALQHAARQIAAGELVRTAAMDAGFADTAHLTRTFRASFGLTPSEAIAGGAQARWCGHLAQPQDYSCECDNGAIVSGGFFEARCHSAELLKLTEAAFDKVTLGIEVLVEGMFLSSGWIIGNDGQRALFVDGSTEIIGVIGGISHDDLGGQVLDQGAGLWGITFLPRRQSEPDGTA
jgi:Helix-turn-helix domain